MRLWIYLVQTEAALMYDAVKLFGKAIEKLDKDLQERKVTIDPLYCEAENTWEHGQALIEAMRTVSPDQSLDSQNAICNSQH